jgi:hypothetical protein
MLMGKFCIMDNSSPAVSLINGGGSSKAQRLLANIIGRLRFPGDSLTGHELAKIGITYQELLSKRKAGRVNIKAERAQAGWEPPGPRQKSSISTSTTELFCMCAPAPQQLFF